MIKHWQYLLNALDMSGYLTLLYLILSQALFLPDEEMT